MPHVVTEKCVKCKYTDCVEVCPVDCFHEGEEYLVIDPEVCIDCGVCVPECPIEAIVNDETYIDGKSLEAIVSEKDSSVLTERQSNVKFMATFNRKRSAELPVIVAKKDPMVEADVWSAIDNKIQFIKDAENG
ncbi:4Fe-4S binding domain protein [Neorickettsia helminthoeca str. Oregon]|uniref:Ferredoxin n=1 Tax=Neorickettsia helminthoeca str. Oregon TaxID=1286528 RepID=X5GW20_9RICK|nr:ferredoxin family protein [Neorickettsia helminthoeca]AHX11272.1 4Fe-4S binding domain protein [Neorickettsia helminthoeca str. Oregon]